MATADSTTFTRDEVAKICKDVLESVIGYNTYNYTQSAQWNQTAIERIIAELVKTNRPYKYIVTSSLMQTANGTGLNVSNVSYWNKSTDTVHVYRWENKHMLAVVHVFIIGL